MSKTLEEAKQELRKGWVKGIECPACTQFVKLYNYKLFATSAQALIILSKLPDGYHHISQYAEATKSRPRAPHFAELRFWGLVEKLEPNTDPKVKSLGMWKITEKGRLFVTKQLEVKSRILVFNNTFCGFAKDSEDIGIVEALGNRFNYAELME